MERAFLFLVVVVGRHHLRDVDHCLADDLFGVCVGDRRVLLENDAFEKRRIVAVEPRPAALASRGKSLEQCFGCGQHVSFLKGFIEERIANVGYSCIRILEQVVSRRSACG